MVICAGGRANMQEGPCFQSFERARLVRRSFSAMPNNRGKVVEDCLERATNHLDLGVEIAE